MPKPSFSDEAMLTYRSPAKVNLFLRVLSKRVDGFHELASLFQAIGLFDHLHIKAAQEDSFSCSDSTLPIDSSNLVLKARNLFRKKTGSNIPVHLYLQKNIPAEAGLGGGSGNAATTLWAMNQLSATPATIEQLKEWSAEIGSDVPFFLSCGTSYCTGRGEIINEMQPLPEQQIWIVKPSVGLSTPAVYRALDASSLQKRCPNALLNGFYHGYPEYINDLEAPAFQLIPELAEIKRELEQGGGKALMSGSGTSFFYVGESLPPLPEGYFAMQVPFVNRPQDRWY